MGTSTDSSSVHGTASTGSTHRPSTSTAGMGSCWAVELVVVAGTGVVVVVGVWTPVPGEGPAVVTEGSGLGVVTVTASPPDVHAATAKIITAPSATVRAPPPIHRRYPGTHPMSCLLYTSDA